MRGEDRSQQNEATISMWELLTSRSLRKPLLIGMVMQLSQQLSGINAVSLHYPRHECRYSRASFVFPGVLLFHIAVPRRWPVPTSREAFYNWCGSCYGHYDSFLHANDGLEWSKNPASLRPWRDVYFQRLYHHISIATGKCSSTRF